jgi:DNA polymerase-3 subunit alpha
VLIDAWKKGYIMSQDFVHLHVHSEYSLLDGAIRCADLARQVAEWGSPAVALTDHGAMYGAVDFYEKCKAQGVKPLIGCEVYLDPRGHQFRDKRGQNYHLLLLARDNKGYKNLVKLVSKANTDGFFYKPRIDYDLLATYGEGLIGSSACLAGEVASLVLQGEEEEAARKACYYQELLGKGNFYLEVMHNSLPEQARANKGIIRIARETGLPIIATNDAHYLRKEDASWHEVLLCVQTQKTINDPSRFSFGAQDFYLRSPEEMWRLFGAELPEALTNTLEIAERCDVEFTFGEYLLPNFELPEGETLDSHLEGQCWEGLRWRLGGEPSQEYKERLEYEIRIIKQMGFPGYFLIVSDFIKAAKERGIPVGPGRGSAAGSLVAWALRITELDPIFHKLLFERFLNPERISMPDIDTDISDKRRDEVIDYVVEKYGRENVSQIITFGRMMSKGAVRDVARALEVSVAEADVIAKLVPDKAKNLREALEMAPDLKQIYTRDQRARQVIDTACHIEGLARHCSQHAAGVVIAPCPITDIVPVRRIADNQVVTQFAMEPVEKLGLVKMDFLGLRTLSLIEDTLHNIKAGDREVPDINTIPMDDAETFRLLQEGDTLGVFQLESEGMRRLLKRMRPDAFGDVVAVLALYRPGPLESGMVDQYVECKHGRQEVSCLHPRITECLAETYGVILYQEQVMQIASALAGYSLGEADLLRRAMGKKKVEVMAEQREKFVQGCVANHVDASRAEEIFNIIEKFAGYGFNKSHSAAYALISYQTAFLKAHYRAEFLAAFLTSQIGSKMDVLGRYIYAVRKSGVQVLPPHINESGRDFSVSGGDIRFGLSAVAKAGNAAVEAMLEARKSGPFLSLWDFLLRVDLRVINKGVLENLIRAGAFDGLGAHRNQLLEVLPRWLELAGRYSEDTQQLGLFEEDPAKGDGPELPELPEPEKMDILAMEKDTLGLYLSGHPVEEASSRIHRYSYCAVEELAFWKGGEESRIILGGMVSGRKEKYTKKGDPMGIFDLEDQTGKVEVVCFPRTWEECKTAVVNGGLLLVEGKVQERMDRVILVDRILSLEEAEEKLPPLVKIVISSEGLPRKNLLTFLRELKGYRGESPVLFELKEGERQVLIRLSDLRLRADTRALETLCETHLGGGGTVEVA